MTILNLFVKRLFVVLVLFSNLGYAQEYLDLARLSYTLAPDNNFDNGNSAGTFNEWNLQLDFPMVLNENKAIIFSGIGNIYNITLHPEQSENQSLYALNLRLGLNTVYNDTWSATYLVLPKLTTDFNRGLRTGYQLGFVALINQKKSTRLKYTYGLFTNTEEYGQLVVPLLGGYYLSPNEKWEFTALMPALLDINYNLGKTTSLGLKYEGIGTTYSIDNEFYDDVYMTRGTTQLFSYFQYRINPSLFVRTKLGYEIRSYRIFDQGDKVALSLASIYFNDNRKVINTELKDNLLLKFEIFYRFNLPKDKTPVLNEKL